ncbi:neurotrypsin-like [Mytilus trossulus]|uniref:neurotrypsin-like n=1 Tax=Mytilus trossulus TaxID=6551 RepID=UPI00300701F4
MFLLAVLSISLSIFAIFAQEDGDLRTVSERLEIFEYGEWGTVCSKGFDDVDARVACRQLGYRYGTSLGDEVPSGTGKIWKSYVACKGTESKLADCKHGKDQGPYTGCYHSYDVGVYCFNETLIPGNIRTVSGILEVFYNGIWGTVCDDNFDDIDARVACKELGYK